MNQQRYSVRFDRRWWYGIPLFFIALLLAFEPTRLDFAIADLFYVHGLGFIGRHNDFLENVLHDRAKQLVIPVQPLPPPACQRSLLGCRWRSCRRLIR